MEQIVAKIKEYLPLILLVVVAVVILRYGEKIYSRIQERQKNRELNKRIDKSNLSYGESQYKVYAQKLLDAMDCWGTDEDAIYDTFKDMNNIDDILQLQRAFSDVEKEEKTLSQWLNTELSSSEKKQLNAIIAERSIEYSF